MSENDRPDSEAEETERPSNDERRGDGGLGSITRRATLGMAGAAGLGLLSGPAVAAEDGANRPWNRNVDAQGHDLRNLGTLEADELTGAVTGAESLRTIAGEHLSIEDGRLNAAGQPVDGEPIAPSNLSVQDWEWVDMIAAGADPTGQEDVVPVMEEVAGENTLLIFPPGTYLFEQSFVQHGHHSFGIKGVGQPTFTVSEDFQPPDDPPWRGGADRVFNLGSWALEDDMEIDNLYVGGFDFDFTEEGVGWAPFNLTGNNWVMEDITVRGTIPSTPDVFWPAVPDPDGQALVRNVSFPDGVDHGIEDVFSAGTLCFVTGTSHGDIRFEDCIMKHGGGNGLRISHVSSSNVVIDGGVYGNSDRAALRIGGTGNHVVKNCDIVVDEHRTGFGNMRGIWVQRRGKPGWTGEHVFENVRIRIEDVPEASTPLWVSQESGNVVARNLFIEDNRGTGDESIDSPTIEVSSGDETTRVTLENVHVEGGTSSHVVHFRSPNNVLRNFFAPDLDPDADAPIYVQEEASDTRVEGAHVDPDAGPIRVEGASDCAIEDVNDETSIDRSSAPRLRVNGWGYNEGDPSAEGDWAGHGTEGLQVRDRRNGESYVYLDGAWRAL